MVTVRNLAKFAQESVLSAYALESSSGDAGSIQLIAPIIFLEKRGAIQSLTFGSGHTGGVILEVDRLRLNGGSQIAVATMGAGHAGDLVIAAHEALTILPLQQPGPVMPGKLW